MSNTRQPVWRYRGNLGDASPLEENAAFVYEDVTGVYPPELVLFDAPAEIKLGVQYEVSRVVCGKCYFTDGILSDNQYHKDMKAWFDVEGVANCHGQDKDQLIEWLCGDDVLARCGAYQMLAEYHGILNFDSYPVQMTRTEIRRRYRAPFRHGSYPV